MDRAPARSTPKPTAERLRKAHLLLGALLVSVTLLTAGCDSATTTPGATSTLPGPAAAVASAELFLDAVGSTKGELLFYPVDVAPGGEFFIDLLSNTYPQTVLISVLHRGLQDGRKQVEVDVSGVGGLFAVELRVDETVQRHGGPFASSQRQVVGSLREQPTSYHFEVIDDGDERVIVVEVDYERGSVGGGGLAWITPTGGGDPVPTTHLDVLPSQPLSATAEIAGVLMHGTGTSTIQVVEQYIE